MKEVIRDSRGAAPCKHCLKKSKGKILSYPEIVVTDNMYYARCPKCNTCDKYDFLALSTQKVIRVWNNYMEGKGFSSSDGEE